jgi:hypothetical protein
MSVTTETAVVRMPVFMPPEGAPKVFAAIVGVMHDIPKIPKTGRNKEHRYDYVEATVLTAKIQDAMIKHRLVLSPREVARSVLGGILFVKYEFDAHCDGEAVFNIGSITGSCRFQFRAGSYDDKAMNKTLTAALKQFEIALFKIPADVDDIERDEDVREPPPRGNGHDTSDDMRPPSAPPPPSDFPGDMPSREAAPPDDGEFPPPGEPPSRDPGAPPENPGNFQDRVRAFAERMSSAYTRDEADKLWRDEAAMLRQCSDTTYHWLADAYEGRWQIQPPSLNS